MTMLLMEPARLEQRNDLHASGRRRADYLGHRCDARAGGHGVGRIVSRCVPSLDALLSR